MKKTMRVLAVILSMLLVLTALGGCVSEGSAGTKPAGSGAQSSQPQTSETDPTDGVTVEHITDGLVAWYTFEDSGNIGRDSSGNENHLYVWSLVDKTVEQVDNSMSSALGKAGKFNGDALLAAQTMEEAAEPSKDFVDELEGSYTITFFARSTVESAPPEEDHRTLVCNGYWANPTSPNLEFSFTYMKDGGWDSFACYLNYGAMMNGLYFRKFQWQVDNGSFYEYGKTDTAWYHYALVIDKENKCIDLYIDGKLARSNSVGQELATQSEEVPFSVGGMAELMDSVLMDDMLYGEMDDLRIYDRVLTVYEIGNIQRLVG